VTEPYKIRPKARERALQHWEVYREKAHGPPQCWILGPYVPKASPESTLPSPKLELVSPGNSKALPEFALYSPESTLFPPGTTPESTLLSPEFALTSPEPMLEYSAEYSLCRGSISLDHLSPPQVENPVLSNMLHAPRLGRSMRDSVWELRASSMGLSSLQPLCASECTPDCLPLESHFTSSAGASPSRVSGPCVESPPVESPPETLIPISVPAYPKERRPAKRPLSTVPQAQVNDWAAKSGVKLGDGLSTDQRDRVTRLLYTYQDLNSTDLEGLPATDLYLHRVRLKDGTPPFNKPRQRRWPVGKEFWLRRIINEGLKYGLYERTMEANGRLSDWNAQAQLVDKSDEPGEWDEPRLTFNYQNVIEEMPAYFLKLMSRVHDYLGHLTHKYFLKLDLKHGYWSILVHPADRHYFAFTIPGIGQLQPTRMPQGSCSAGFSFTELMYLVLGLIPPNQSGTFSGKESIIVSDAENMLPRCTFYVDDIFLGVQTFDEGYDLLADEILPRIEWAKLKLSFKKLELFVKEIVALGVLHQVGGRVFTKPERCDKIRDFPVPRDASGIRRFLGTIGLCRRWVKNFGEIK
jgi:hypothetical protein